MGSEEASGSASPSKGNEPTLPGARADRWSRDSSLDRPPPSTIWGLPSSKIERVATTTTEGIVHLGEHQGVSILRRRRLLYAVTTVALTAIVGGAVVDAIAPFGVYGVDTRTISASGDDSYDLRVRYGTVSRPALATPFDIEVHRQGGFDGRHVTVAVLSTYLAMWDENGVDPSPAEETADASYLFWTFDPPEGDTLRITFDGRIEPAAQSGERGRVAVIDDGGAELVAVDFRTRVLP
jgi:hypothetical protein